MTTELTITGIDRAELDRVLRSGQDHGGNEIEPFTDADGGWPLRCCLTDSAPGDRIAIIAWSPFEWEGPYRETGPIVVHVDGCARTDRWEEVPEALDNRAMVLRPYGHDRRIAYDHVRFVDAGGSLTEEVRQLLDHPDIDFVHARNATGGCLSFQARLTPVSDTDRPPRI